jgi:CRISPR-associated endonuclease Cas2
MMLVVVAYDVSTESEEGRKRLRRVARRFARATAGRRVQNSVFECLGGRGEVGGARAGAADWGD